MILTRKRKEAIEDKSFAEGWDLGYTKGSRLALNEGRKVFTYLITKEIAKIRTEASSLQFKDQAEQEAFASGLNRAIEIINRKK